jgi:hypothetical protein
MEDAETKQPGEDIASSNSPHALRRVASDPISMAGEAVDIFNQLQTEYVESHGRLRNLLYDGLTLSYSVAVSLLKDEDALRDFAKDNFFSLSRQKPKRKTIMRHVLYYTTRARNDRERNRLVKYAKVLDDYMHWGVSPADFRGQLEKIGGVDQMYREICANAHREAADDATQQNDDVDADKPDYGTVAKTFTNNKIKDSQGGVDDQTSTLEVEMRREDLAHLWWREAPGSTLSLRLAMIARESGQRRTWYRIRHRGTTIPSSTQAEIMSSPRVNDENPLPDCGSASRGSPALRVI